MNVRRRRLRRLALAVAWALAPAVGYAQLPPRIIDMHVHAFRADWPSARTPFNVTTGRASTAKTGTLLKALTVAELGRHHVSVAVLSGPLDVVREWVRDHPGRFIGAPQFPMTYLQTDSAFRLERYVPTPAEIKAAAQAGQIGAIGEITAQYLGWAPGDSALAPFFALAEELDLPVGIHTGTGPPLAGLSYPDHTLSVGNPMMLESVLTRHPRLRLYLMHAGYPYLEGTLAILHKYPQVHVDLSAINWRLPRTAFHEYLRALVRHGFADRLMFGSDSEAWPEGIALAIRGIDSAPFLTPAQKADIFYNNAARFLRLTRAADGRGGRR